MTKEQLISMNQQIETTKIKGKDYAMVHERIKALRAEMPNASIITEIVDLTDGVVTIKATVTDDTGRILGTGHAQEKDGSSNINMTSFVENCETSAVGRALGMCAIGIDRSFASADEVANAQLQQKELEPITERQAEIFKTMCKTRGKTPNDGFETMTGADYKKAMDKLMKLPRIEVADDE